MVSVANGRRIDDNLDPLGGVNLAMVETVLRAKISGGFGRKLAPSQGIKFGAVAG